MPNPIQSNDLIALRDALPQHNLSPGRIGRVLQVFIPEEAEIEFVDNPGHTVATIHLKIEQFTVLRHQATLDEETFWKLIEDAKAASGGDSEEQVQLLVDKVAAMPLADIFRFYDLFHEFKGIAYRRDLWAAAYIICDGCSDDGFTDFRAWLIAQGKKIFYGALHDPESLLDVARIICDGYATYGDASLEAMNYVAHYAYEQKIGEEMPTFFGSHPHPELTGEDWDETRAKQKYPKLAAKFEAKVCDEKSE